MDRRNLAFLAALTVVGALPLATQAQPKKISIDAAPIATDKAVKYDYDIVYVRSPRWLDENGKKRAARWAEFAHLFNVTPGSDLLLLRPDGTEELLVPGGAGAIQDPYVSFDGEWVYYTKFHVASGEANPSGADVYRVHVKSRKVVQLTRQEFAASKEGVKPPYGVYNMHPCPLPGGRVAFVSNRNGYLPPPKSYPPVALQLHTMDDDGSNIETIGHLNLAGALHPVILKDGRIIFSSLENMGLRNYILWGIWSIHPDGSNWGPLVSALHGHSSPSSWHFQTQLADDNIIVELYYNQNQRGFGSLFKLPPQPPYGEAAFGPGDITDARNPGWPFLGAKNNTFRIPFTPYGMEAITPWIRTNDFPAWTTDWDDPKSTRIGKVTHPCGAPDNHLLLAWTLGPIGGSAGSVREYMVPQPIDSGIYLLKDGAVIREPGQMLTIKNDPNYNEQWPRPLVPYRRIHGVDEPKQLVRHNDGKTSPHLPEGTPFGLVGTSSIYKRESAPLGSVAKGSVTATISLDSKKLDDVFTGAPWNWRGQGADAGLYPNSDIHAIRVLAFEPNAHTTEKGQRYGYPPYHNHAMERFRILGEVPVRHFEKGAQPTDPDGNPDTSFLAKIPADVAFTFQTIDKDGMVLNMAQTWHQVRPGEIRNDCGGCHAHSQKPTPFALTASAKPDYGIFDLTRTTPLLTARANDQSGKQWDEAQETGLRFEKVAHDVEYHRDIRPILNRSCLACHTKQSGKPAAGLVLDDDDTTIENMPGTYFRLAGDERARFSPRRLQVSGKDGTYTVRALQHSDSASHYIWKFQSRRSLLVWNIYGKRLDGWKNEAIASGEIKAGDPRRAKVRMPGDAEVPADLRLYFGDIDYAGSVMPPPAAVAGTYEGPDGKRIKVAALNDEDRRMIVRWIDLGCPIDLDPKFAGVGGISDDQRPTLTLTYPNVGKNESVDRILIGMHDYHAGIDPESFTVTADFAVDGVPAGQNLASKFKTLPENRWELRLTQPMAELPHGKLVVAVRDRVGNWSRVERSFSVGKR